MSNNNLEYSYLLSDILSKLGVRYACISPGMRNSALTQAFLFNTFIDCISHIDERSSCFYALGLGKSSQSPATVITTSGTATANLLPGIIEANLSKTPLIVITADRPMELVGTGENQTINQHNIYGNHVRDFLHCSIKNEKKSLFYNKIIKLFNNSMGTESFPRGPVHINISFEEPITAKPFHYTSEIKNISNKKYERENKCNLSEIELNDSIIICGEIPPHEEINSIFNLAEHLNAPILADPTSNIRYSRIHPNVISNYNFLMNSQLINSETIIRFGRKPTSKLLCKLLHRHQNTILVDRYPEFNDNSTRMIVSSYKNFSEKVITTKPKIYKSLLLDSLADKQVKVNSCFKNLNFEDRRCEGLLINRIIEKSEKNTNIFIGNSMAVRQMDDCTSNIDKNINIYCNRGASGIDGLVSTALGIASINKKQNNVAILGDLSLYHDMNGLLAASRKEINLQIVVLNNNGGGIFSDLDIYNVDDNNFNEYWTTPTDLDIRNIAQLYNLNYQQATGIDETVSLIFDRSKETRIIDYKIDIELSKKNRMKLKKEIEKLLNN